MILLALTLARISLSHPSSRGMIRGAPPDMAWICCGCCCCWWWVCTWGGLFATKEIFFLTISGYGSRSSFYCRPLIWLSFKGRLCFKQNKLTINDKTCNRDTTRACMFSETSALGGEEKWGKRSRRMPVRDAKTQPRNPGSVCATGGWLRRRRRGAFRFHFFFGSLLFFLRANRFPHVRMSFDRLSLSLCCFSRFGRVNSPSINESHCEIVGRTSHIISIPHPTQQTY